MASPCIDPQSITLSTKAASNSLEIAKKLSILTAYDFNTARVLAEANLDYILVGDSLAMVALGYKTTKDLEPSEMLSALKAVKRGAPKTKIIADLTFLSFSKSCEQALADASELYQNGADLVKIEGSSVKAIKLFKELNKLGYQTMGHLGYTPQTEENFKDSKVIRDEQLLLNQAKLLDREALVSMIVLEMIPADISTTLSSSVRAKTIGIGSGKGCDGQVLVTDDLLGRFNLFKPKFVRRFASQFEDSVIACQKFKQAVQSQEFPAEAEIIN